MLGVPLLRRSEVVAECEKCGAMFDPGAGGYCHLCNRLLCEQHYHGSRWQKLWRVLTGTTICRECTGPSVVREPLR